MVILTNVHDPFWALYKVFCLAQQQYMDTRRQVRKKAVVLVDASVSRLDVNSFSGSSVFCGQSCSETYLSQNTIIPSSVVA